MSCVGLKFGRWTVMEYAAPIKYRKMCLCVCDCGNKKIVLEQNLKRGASKSCGCLIHDTFWKGCGDLSSTHWSRIQGEAAQRNIELDITIEYIWDLFLKQDKKCALTGIPIKFADSIKKYWDKETTASLDRIDNTKGYLKNNVQWVHKVINRIKWDLSEKELYDWCKLITNKFEKNQKYV